MAMSFLWDTSDIIDAAPTDTKIIVSKVQRPVIYPTTRRKLSIPGRDYSWDFGDGDLEDYNIIVDLILTGKTVALTQSCADAVAALLTGREDLKFSDSATIHSARIYDAVMASGEAGGTVIKISITFECDGGGLVI